MVCCRERNQFTEWTSRVSSPWKLDLEDRHEKRKLECPRVVNQSSWDFLERFYAPLDLITMY